MWTVPVPGDKTTSNFNTTSLICVYKFFHFQSIVWGWLSNWTNTLRPLKQSTCFPLFFLHKKYFFPSNERFSIQFIASSTSCSLTIIYGHGQAHFSSCQILLLSSRALCPHVGKIIPDNEPLIMRIELTVMTMMKTVMVRKRWNPV